MTCNIIWQITEEETTDEHTIIKKDAEKKIQSLNLTSTTKKILNDTDGASKVTTVYESAREITRQSYAGDATHTCEIDTSIDR